MAAAGGVPAYLYPEDAAKPLAGWRATWRGGQSPGAGAPELR